MISLLVLIGGTLTIVLGEPVRVREPVKVVGQVGQQTTTLSCALPQSWSKCTFVKHSEDHQASCEIDNGEQSTQSCFEFNVNNSKSWLYIDRDNEPPRCFVQISDLQREHNGTYSCFFENALTLSRTPESEDKTSDVQKKMDAPHRLPHPLSSNHFRIPSSPVKHFTLTVLIWPSGILVTPQMDTIERYEYRLEQPVDTFLDIFNVQPMPHVVWTMDDDVIDGISIETSSIRYDQSYDLMNVKKRLQFLGKREFHEKLLQFNLTMDLITEDGEVTVLNLKSGNITLVCLDPLPTIPPSEPTTPHQNSTQSSTMSSTTLSSTSTTSTARTTTTTTTTTTATTTETTTTTATTTPATTITTTTTSATATTTTLTPVPPETTSVTIATTTVIEECSYNLTSSTGDFGYPVPGVDCQNPEPSWDLVIACEDNCYHVINLWLHNLTHTNPDPCASKLMVGPNAEDAYCFNATDKEPVKIEYEEKQVTMKLLNLTDDNPVSFSANFWFSV